MSDKVEIKKFVQNVLGCGCAEEVFQTIEHGKNVPVCGDVCVSDRINIGNRLLVYVLETNDTGFIKDYMADLVRNGIKERDEQGYNRFRLAISTDRVEEVDKIAGEIFNDLRKDDRVYLHVIKKGETASF